MTWVAFKMVIDRCPQGMVLFDILSVTRGARSTPIHLPETTQRVGGQKESNENKEWEKQREITLRRDFRFSKI